MSGLGSAMFLLKQVRNGIIRLEKTKTLNKRNIPINEDLAQVFKDIQAEQGLSSKYVFTRNGKVIKRLDVGYNAAVKRAGIEDFTFHDLRHTFASHLVMKGRNLKEVQELLGHKDIKTTMRYAHLAPEYLKKAVNVLDGLTGYIKSDMSEICQISKMAPATN